MKPAASTEPDIVGSGFFCLRTHLLPFDRLVEWSRDLTAIAADPSGRDAALEADRAVLRERLRAVVTRPEVREALFVASPSLDDAIDSWLQHPADDRSRRVERSLIKYFARLTARPTPFGLFAAVATGRIERETRLCVPSPAECHRHTRLDNEYLFALTSALGRDPAIRNAARYYPNDSLTFAAGQGRYAEARPDGGGHTFHLVGVDETEPLRETLALAGSPGGASRTALAEALLNRDTTLAEAEAFIDELIESQLLINDLGVRVTGPEPAGVLADQLAATLETRTVGQRLRETIDAIGRLDALPPGQSPARYREIAAGLASLPAPAELPRLFQVDLVRPRAGSLGESVVQELQRAAILLHRLTPPETDPLLERFALAFSERYQGRNVPLLEALDDEVGIGAALSPGEDPSPLLRGLPLAPKVQERYAVTPAMRLRLHRAGVAAADGLFEWKLSSSDMEHLSESSRRPLPGELAAFATIAATSSEAVGRGEFELYTQYFDPSASALLGRFCHADPHLTGEVVRHLRQQEALDPEALHAEVVHLPQGRLGNILLRPVLREWEITYLGHSGAPRERQIPATDLLLEVRDGRFILRSKSLGRRIVPRLASAHNYGTGLSPYRFLAMLQHQDVATALHWQWGVADSLPFLPRVTHGRLVLSLARWNLSPGQVRTLRKGSAREQFDAVQEFRNRRGLPRWVTLANGDNRLPVDLDNVLAVETLLHEIGSQPIVILEELWPSPDCLLARGPEGGYRHELVVPLVVRRKGLRPGSASEPEPTPPIQTGPKRQLHQSGGAARRFAPGSEWLYLKLYTSAADADNLLDEVVGPLGRHFHSLDLVHSWFFLRYTDPEHHLRWRLKGPPEELWRRVWPEIENAVSRRVADGRVWRLQLDTYEREVERYGGPEGIEWAERIFQADSEAVVDLLGIFDPGDAGLEERWRVGLAGVDRLFEDFGLSLQKRLDQLGECARYGSVPEPDTALRQLLSERFRSQRAGLEALLDPSAGPAGPYAPALDVLQRRSSGLLEPVAALRSLARNGQLSVSPTALIGSCVHMHLNRLMQGAAKAHETVIYDFLRRIYQSRMGRGG